MDAHRADVVACFLENGGNLRIRFSADNQSAHLPFGRCQRGHHRRNVRVLHPAMVHSLLHSPDEVRLRALIEMVEEIGDVLVGHIATPHL